MRYMAVGLRDDTMRARLSLIHIWETADPVFATLLALIMVKQIPSTTEVIGCVIVVAALLLYNKSEREAEQTHV